MKRPFTSSDYSLVPRSLVLGVAALCFIAIFGDYGLLPVAEIQPTPGVLVDANNNNMVAIQVTRVGGNNKIYKL